MHLSGTTVSRGVAVGRARHFYGQFRQYSKAAVNDVDQEAARLESAAQAAVAQLGSLEKSHKTKALAEIVEVHRMMIENSDLVANSSAAIRRNGVNAEWALKLESERRVNELLASEHPHLREKAIDLQDAAERIQDFLAGDRTKVEIKPGTVIVASEIHPSTLISLAETPPAAIVTEHGGWTSHVFIIAREMQIPAVAGVANALRKIRDGSTLTIDADAGEIILTGDSLSSRDTLDTPPNLLQQWPLPQATSADRLTGDGVPISISANAELPENCARALDLGADGIGLLRSEYLFDLRLGVPDFETQEKAYRASIEVLAGRPCRIRTFDVPMDRLADRGSTREKNPALGLRGIRYSLKHEDEFRIQLSAILYASKGAQVEIAFPLVSSIDEVIKAGEILRDEAQKANAEVPRFGALIEVPAAVLMSETILQHVDFVCVGSNDLVQYLLAADRDNDAVANLYQTLHPAVIRSLKIIADAANLAGKEAAVCGEVAGSSYYTALLIGLGFRSLSMNPKSIAKVRSLLPGITLKSAEDLAERVLAAKTTQEAETVLSEFHGGVRASDNK